MADSDLLGCRAKRRRISWGAGILAVVLSVIGVPVAGQSPSTTSVDRILRRMLLSGRTVNLRGRQVVMHPGANGPDNITHTRIVRSSDGRSLMVGLEPAKQRGVITQDDGTWTRYYHPALRRIAITHSIPRVSDERGIRRLIRLIHRNYQVYYERRDPIAGRMCHLLRFEPRLKAGRPPLSRPMKLWVDVNTGVVLSHQESDFFGNTLTLMVFASVEYPGRIAASELRYAFPRNVPQIRFSRSAILRDIAEVRRRTGFDIVLPLRMPGGYVFDNCELMSLNGVPVVSLRYTDGLTNITICQNLARVPRPSGLRSLKVARPSQGETLVACASGPMEYMVVGRGEPVGLVAVARALDRERERACLDTIQRMFHAKPAVLALLRNRGLCVETIAALLAIQKQTGQSLSALLTLYGDGWDWRGIAGQSRTSPFSIQNAIQRIPYR